MPIDNLPALNDELEHMNVSERISHVHGIASTLVPSSTVHDNPMIMFTSGGKKFAVLPHIMRNSLGDSAIPIVFVDTQFYPQSTLHSVQWLKERNYHVQTYRSKMSREDQEREYGDQYWDRSDENFAKFQRIAKHEPQQQAISDYKPMVMMGGRMREQTAMRSTMDILEQKGKLFQFNPLADWSSELVQSYIENHSLPVNKNHYDLTKQKGSNECHMWYI